MTKVFVVFASTEHYNNEEEFEGVEYNVVGVFTKLERVKRELAKSDNRDYEEFILDESD